MTRILEQDAEDKQSRRWERAGKAIARDLVAAVERNGGFLTGFSMKLDEFDVLLVLKAEFPGGPQVAFVGGGSPEGVVLKAVAEAKRDGLRWKPDRWAKAES